MNGGYTQYRCLKIKLEDQGMTCMFLGYVQNNNGGTYRMFNIHTKRIVLNHDAIWLNQNYGDYVSRR